MGRRLLSGSPCPVAVAPRGFRHRAAAPRTVKIAFECEQEASSAVEEGTRLARSLGGGVELLCLVPPLAAWAIAAGADAGYSRGDVESHHHSAFAHVLAAALALVPDDVPAEGRLIEGRPAAALRREIEHGGDLLVMASPGARPAPGVRPGATAIGVMASCPAGVAHTHCGEGDRSVTGRFLIVYASTRGHTAKVASRMASVLATQGAEVDLRDVAGAGELRPLQYDVVIVAGSVHAGRHQQEIIDWAKHHAAALSGMSTGFVSVCLAAADDSDEARRAARDYIEDMQDDSGWRQPPPGRSRWPGRSSTGSTTS